MGPKRHDGRRLTPTEREDLAAAAIFDAACAAIGTNEEAAEFFEHDPSHLLKMRKGTKSTPTRLLDRALRHERAALAMMRVMSARADVEPPQPRHTLTTAQVKEVCLDATLENPAVMARAEQIAFERFGASPEEFRRAARMVLDTKGDR